jgi:tripartite motif-containing protein 71
MHRPNRDPDITCLPGIDRRYAVAALAAFGIAAVVPASAGGKKKKRKKKPAIYVSAGFLGAHADGTATGAIDAPGGVATRGDEVLVADRGQRRLHVWGTDGVPRSAPLSGADFLSPGFWGGRPAASDYNGGRVVFLDGGGSPRAYPAGGTDAALDRPWGIADDGAGGLFVADSGNGRVVRLGPDPGYPWTEWDGTDRGAPLETPSGIAVGPDGLVYVAEFDAHRVQVFTKAGRSVRRFGSLGTGPGQLVGPMGVAVGRAGEVFVADRANGRVQRFSAKGAYLGAVGAPGTGVGQLGEPYGVAIDGAGVLWVAEYANARVQAFAPRR